MSQFATLAIPKTPQSYGLPAKYAQWQQYQREAIKRVIASYSRDVAVAGLMMPTGTGKSVVAMSLAKHFIQHYEKPDGSPVRAGILVGTKFLQDQYAKDFPGMVADVRGMGNYPCHALKNMEFAPEIQARFWPSKLYDPTCDQAPCLVGIDCPRRQFMAMKSCEYFDAVGRARVAPIVVTNYLYYMLSSIGELDLLICDEAHALIAQLDQVARIEHKDMPPTLDKAKSWAQARLDDLHGEQTIEGIRERDRMHRILAINRPSNWVHIPGEKGRPGAWAPIRLTSEAGVLANAAKHILLMSATLRESDVKEFVDAVGDSRANVVWNYHQYPSPFSISKRPLIHVVPDPPMKVGFKMSPFEKRRLFQMVDEIIDGEAVALGQRGIVHSASYQWALDYLTYTKHKGIIYFPKHKDQLGPTVARFKLARGGAVLLSPSVTTGLDFPGDECRWQVILKVPFPSRADPLLVEREKLNKKHAQHVAVSTLSQALGRGVRSQSDECSTFVLDYNLKWVLFSDGDAPKWVKDAYRSVGSYQEWVRSRSR